MFSAKVNDFLESRTPSGGPPSDLEWQGFPTPQPGKTKYSSLSQISLRINKKSSVALLVPLNPLVTSPNICCHPTLEWTLFQGLESSIPHTILWIPTCALIWILHVTIIAFIFFPVRNNRVPPQRSSRVNFLVTIAALISSLWETIVCLLRGAFVSTLKHNHCTYIFPCVKQSCASSEELSRELCNHNCCTDIIPVRDNCMSPQGGLLFQL